MAQLTISLLGTFEVNRNDLVAHFETDATRALLTYLVLHAGTTLQREVLANLLWPDQPGSDALHALRQTLNRLRRAIGDREAAPPFLHITRQSIQFNRESDYQLDVSAYTSLIDSTRHHAHRRLQVCRICMQQLEQAAELYQGDLLTGFYLDSIPFEEWLLMEREHLHRQAMEVFYLLAEYYERRRSYERAQHYARRQLELEPWREEGHRQLMRALALSGQRSAALAQYENTLRALEDELGVGPAEGTVQLYKQIRSGTIEPSSPPPHNLPATLTAFVGRDSELAQIAERINRPDCRLLTLVGPGGIGKTRLAMQAAAAETGSFQDGVHWTPLASVRAPELLTPALAQTLKIVLYHGESPQVQMCNYLRNKEMLLILDSFEHVLTGAGLVAEWLRHAPNLNILVTSRERLNVPGEWLLHVDGLTYPQEEQLESLGAESYEAIQLFISSAQRIQSEFHPSPANQAAMLRVCQMVGGMPLAIELAASWLQVFSCQEIPQEIQKDLDFLSTSMQGVPERHRSLRAVFDASWALLSAQEKAVLSRMSVLWGDFDRPAAEQVAGATASDLASLVRKSLLRQETHGNVVPAVRYEMHDMLQRYAAEKLAARPQEEEHTRNRHSAYYLDMLMEQYPPERSGTMYDGPDVIGVEIKDIRAAWDWALSQGQMEVLIRAMPSLFAFYDERSWFQEGADVFGRVNATLSATQTTVEQSLLGRAMIRQGWFVFRLGEREQGLDLMEQGLQLSQRLGLPNDVIFALNRLGAASLDLGDYDRARQYCGQSLTLSQELGHPYEEALAGNILGQAAYYLGEYSEAERYCRQSLALADQANLQKIAADSHRHLGNIFYFLQDYTESNRHYEQALQYYREMGNRWGESATLSNIGGLLSRQGNYAQSKAIYNRVLQIKREIGDRWGQANVLSNLGVIANECGYYMQARQFFEQSLQIRHELGARQGEALTRHNLGVVCMYLGRYAESMDFLEQSLQLRRKLRNREGVARSLATLSLLLHQTDADLAAIDAAREALQIAQELGVQAVEAEALTNLGHALVALGRLEEAAPSYQRALHLRREFKRKENLVMEPLAGLARVALARQEMDQAHSLAQELLRNLEALSLDGIEEPFRIYQSTYQVLLAHESPQAQDLLDKAYRLLQERAARIGDAETRRCFLQNVTAHRYIVEEWERQQP